MVTQNTEMQKMVEVITSSAFWQEKHNYEKKLDLKDTPAAQHKLGTKISHYA